MSRRFIFTQVKLAGRRMCGNKLSYSRSKRKQLSMKQKVLTLSVLLALLISACAPKAAPTLDPVDVQHTAEAAAFTMVAQTEQVMPTDTAVPPTATSTLPATLTPLPTLTVDASLPTVTGVATTGGLATSVPPTSPATVAATDANCNKALTSWKGPTSN